MSVVILRFVSFLLDLIVTIPFLIVRTFYSHKQDEDLINNKFSSIVLIHGSGANHKQFLLGEYILRSKHRIYKINLDPSKQCSIQQHAIQLSDFIQSNQLKSVTLLGVSMGGLVASYYAENLKSKDIAIERIVTIGTPFQGAPLLSFIYRYVPNWINFLNTKRHQQMTPNSSFLQNLNLKLKDTRHHYFTIGSLSDLHVPDKYSKPALQFPTHRHVTLMMPGHIALTLYWRIFHLVCE